MSNATFNTDWIQRTTRGRWLTKQASSVPQPVAGFSIDTRTLEPGQAYIAIRGKTFDGHAFAQQAIDDHSAALAIIDEQAADQLNTAANDTQPLLVVPDTVAALQQLASAHRGRLASEGCRVIAVVGSNGKTTTRHMIHHWLTQSEAPLQGTQSPKSFNNHIGVPLTLLAAAPANDFVACEIGTNHPGEIDALGAIAQPDIAVMTSIGEEHLEFFKDLTGVAKEEAAIVAHLKDSGGLVLHPETLAWLEGIGTSLNHARLHQPDHNGPHADNQPLPGVHNLQNAMLAVEVGKLMGIAPSIGTWRGFEPPEGRMNVIESGGLTLINDAYNANPSSVRASLSILEAWPKAKRRVAILGAMHELGDQSQELHAQIATETIQRADKAFFIGEDFGAPPWSIDDAERIAQELQPGDVVLLKASRGQRLERFIPLIQARFKSPEHPQTPR